MDAAVRKSRPAAAGGAFAAGFHNLDREVRADRLLISGRIPSWLDGALIRVGPARFDLGQQTVNHWFDGLAMLHRFAFADGRVSYANRFLRSDAWCQAWKNGALARREFASDPKRAVLRRLRDAITPTLTDNCNVNIATFGEASVALTETRRAVRFDPHSLETLGEFAYRDEIGGAVASAHPTYDAERRCHYSYTVDFGWTSRYRLFAIDARTGQQHALCDIPAERPAYVHSIGMTRRFLILAECPFVVDPTHLLLRDLPFIRHYRWLPEHGLRLHVVEKDSGQVVRTTETDPVFAFHHVNAFEQGGAVVADIVTHADAAVIDRFYLSRLRRGEPVDGTGQLTRYTIPLSAASAVQHDAIGDAGIELPRIDDRRAGMAYRHVWGAGRQLDGNFLDCVIKIDLATGAARRWWRDDCYPGEPVFVPSPNARREDDGILLTVVFDAAAAGSFLLLLDAASLCEIGRAECPHAIPFGFHGAYDPRPAAGTGVPG